MIAGVKRAEFITAAFGAILAVTVVIIPLLTTGHGQLLTPLLGATLLAMAAWIAWQDSRTFTIPDAALVVIAIIAIVARLHGGEATILQAGEILLEAAICGGGLLCLREMYFRYRGVDGLGFGDVKLAAAAGALLGVEAFSWALLLASLSALCVVAASALANKSRPIERLPFGAFLAPICWGVWTLRSFGVAW